MCRASTNTMLWLPRLAAVAFSLGEQENGEHLCKETTVTTLVSLPSQAIRFGQECAAVQDWSGLLKLETDFATWQFERRDMDQGDSATLPVASPVPMASIGQDLADLFAAPAPRVTWLMFQPWVFFLSWRGERTRNNSQGNAKTAMGCILAFREKSSKNILQMQKSFQKDLPEFPRYKASDAGLWSHVLLPTISQGWMMLIQC